AAPRSPRRPPTPPSAAGHPPLPVRSTIDSLPSRRTPHPRVPESPRPPAPTPEPAAAETTDEPAVPKPHPTAPLPKRGAPGAPRATPAEARPGTQPGAPRVSFADAGAILALTRRDGSPVNDPEGPAPGLPKREAQTHMVPQLRRDSDEFAEVRAEVAGGDDTLHTPDLMAAFRQGYDRALSTPEEAPTHEEFADRRSPADRTANHRTPADRTPADNAPAEPPARAD
ncbi:hypothetical protein GA0115257_12051, partial [Streptomyces sp. LcepLS]